MPIALPLADAAVALVGLLLIAAAVPLAQLTVRVLGLIPIVGGPLSKVLYTGFLSGVAVLVQWQQQSADAFASVVQGPVVGVWTAVDMLVGEDWAIVQTVYALATVTLPRLVGWTWALVDQTRAGLVALIAADVQWIVTWAAGQLAQQAADLVAVVQWAAGAIAAEGAALELRALAREAAITGYAQQLAAAAFERADADALASEQFAAAAARVAEGYAESLFANEITRARAAEGALADWVGGVARTLQGEIESGDAAGAAAAAAAVGAVAARVARVEESPCFKACGPLGDLGGLLQQLEDFGLEAILLGLIAEARSHPDQVASLIDSTIGAAGREAASSLRLGIPA